MLIIACLWIVLTFSFWGLGKMLVSIFRSREHQDFTESCHLFLGLSFAGLLTSIWYCFFPVNIAWGGILVGLGIGFGLANLSTFQKFRYESPWIIGFCFFLFGGLLIKAAAPTGFYDCGLYYVQTVRWAQAFPAVPGLGNVHVRLGNASAWLFLTAAFDWPTIFRGEFDDLGELLLLWFATFHAANALRNTGFERFLSLGLIVFSVWQGQHLLSAPSPDLACGLLGMQTLWQFRRFLKSWNPKEPNRLGNRGMAMFFQSLFLAQIKLSAFPFLLICVLVIFLLLRKGWVMNAFKLACVGLAVAGFMIYRNYILSGYAVFPVLHGGLAPDWLIPRPMVDEYLLGVKGFARHILTREEMQHGLTYSQEGKYTVFEWIPIWVKDRKWTDWIAIGLAASGWLLLVRFAMMHVKRSFKEHWPLIFFTWFSGMLLLFWFSNAPDIRFGLAILGVGFSYACASILGAIGKRIPLLNHIRVAQVLVTFLSVWAIWLCRDKTALMNYKIFPPHYKEISVVGFEMNNGGMLYTPRQTEDGWIIDTDQCWDAPLPCSPNHVEGLEFRGKSLGEGFRMKESQPITNNN